jgi:hypothetical protein
MSTKSIVALALVVAVVVGSVALVGGAPGPLLVQEEPDALTSQETTYVRVVHASPDAPAVDVLVENETVVANASFGDVTDYLELAAGTYNVTVTAAGDPDTVVFEDQVTFDARSATTVAASGEISEGANTSFVPVAFADDALAVDENESAVRVVHLSPDAPTVDVTVGEGNETVVLADNVSFRNASSYVTVPSGNYTVDVRAATAGNNGTVVTSVDVSLASGTVYSAMAVGYLDPETAPADTPFDVLLTEDAQTTITVPSEETPMPTPTVTPGETGNATATVTETETTEEAET